MSYLEGRVQCAAVSGALHGHGLVSSLCFDLSSTFGRFLERDLNLDLVRRVVVGYCPVSSLRWSLVFISEY